MSISKPTRLKKPNGWRPCFAFECIIHFVLLGSLRAEPISDWRSTIWDGESAWEASSSGWTAVVSEGRARLVSLAQAGRGENLLFAPSKTSISWGGHRCWLGPQREWKAIWPPPRDWEASAAAAVKARGPILTVILPHTDPNYPPLTRSYEWRAGVLRCCLSWQDERRHAIQIIQMPQWTTIHANRAIQPDLPLGYALLPISDRTTIETQRKMASGIGRIEGDEVTLWHANVTEKLAFARQELTAKSGPYQLKMRRGDDGGVAASAPDLGLLTQVYLGDWQNPFVELEQLSAFGSDKPASSVILIEPSRPQP